MPLSGGLEEQPARWYQMVTIFGGATAAAEKKKKKKKEG